MGSSSATLGLGLPALLGSRRQAPLCGLAHRLQTPGFVSRWGGGTDIFT